MPGRIGHSNQLMTYLFLQCVNASCQFRFPTPAQEAAGIRCPRCRSEVNIVEFATQSIHNSVPDPPAGPVWSALLDNIRSIHNTGSMFRTADGASIQHLYLCGITATPEHPKLAKAALGAHMTVNWSYSPNGVQTAEKLRCEGYHLYGLERLSTGNRSSTPSHPRIGDRSVLVVGNEKAGVDPGILALCDGVISLPMLGYKSSLNVAVAFGITAYALRFGQNMLAVHSQERVDYDPR